MKKKIEEIEKIIIDNSESYLKGIDEVIYGDVKEVAKKIYEATRIKLPEEREIDTEHICQGKHGCRKCHALGSNMMRDKIISLNGIEGI